MGADLLKIQANQRVDVADMNYAVDGGVQANVREAGAQFLTNPDGQRFWVLDGFAIDNSDGSPLGGVQLRVTRGRGIFSQREGSEVQHGLLLTAGDVEKIIDTTTFADAGYSVYVRFEYVDGDTESRIFWDSAGTGSEFAQSVATRRLANWSIRIETASPGAEWSKIGEMTKAGGVITVITDKRPMYFEGTVDSSYDSGWSTDGGGGTNDRNADRQQYGVTDLQTFTGAMRQCLEDIKGRGLRDWWDRDIGGMNIGFNANPVEDALGVGNFGFRMDYNSGNPRLWWDEGTGDDYIGYNRSTNLMDFVIAGSTELTVRSTGIVVPDGLVVGHAGAPITDTASVGDADFHLDFNSGNPRLLFDAGTDDYIEYNRASDLMQFYIAGTKELELQATGLVITDGLVVGFSAAPVTDTVAIGDVDFRLEFAAGSPRLRWDGTSYLAFGRTGDKTLGIVMDGSTKANFMESYAPFGPSLNIDNITPLGVIQNPSATGQAHCVNRNTSPFMVGKSNAAATALDVLGASWNVGSYVRQSLGVYDYTYTNPPGSDPASAVAIATAQTGGIYAVATAFTTYIRVRTYDNAGAAAESPTSLVVFHSINS